MNIPWSFSSFYGNILYFILVKLKRSWKHSDLKTDCPVTVSGILDLNEIPGTVNQITAKKCQLQYKTKWTGTLKTIPIGFELKLNQSGFAVGENVPVYVCVKNLSDQNVQHCTLVFQRVTTCQVRNDKRVTTDDIITITSPAVPPGQYFVWQNLSLQIPNGSSLPVCNLSGCSLIIVEYRIKVR